MLEKDLLLWWKVVVRCCRWWDFLGLLDDISRIYLYISCLENGSVLYSNFELISGQIRKQISSKHPLLFICHVSNSKDCVCVEVERVVGQIKNINIHQNATPASGISQSLFNVMTKHVPDPGCSINSCAKPAISPLPVFLWFENRDRLFEGGVVVVIQQD